MDGAGGLTAAAICASLGVDLQAWGERVLQEVHVEVVLALHGFLDAQLEDVGEIAGGVKPQIHDGISDAECERKGEKTQLEYVCHVMKTHKHILANRFILLMVTLLIDLRIFVHRSFHA